MEVEYSQFSTSG